MKHPRSRAQRRHNGIVWRDRNRRRMLTWGGYRRGAHPRWDPTNNNMWWARKQFTGHGNRCMCSYEKTDRKYVRKRRRQLDEEIIMNIRSWEVAMSAH